MRPVLCPIDFSEASRAALRYGAVIAANVEAGLIVMTVNDPLLAQAADMHDGEGSLDREARAEAERFFHDTFSGNPPGVTAEFRVATGKPATEIVRVGRESGARLVVMSSRGVTGIRKLFLGSITERVLRETTLPVLVTPPADHGPVALDAVRKSIKRILVPVDLTEAGVHQVRVARQVSETLGGPPLIVAHVIEPVRAIVPGHAYAANVDSERRNAAEQRLQALVEDLPPRPRVESLVVFGDPAEEIAKIATARDAALIVVGLQATAQPGARMGSVTYRVLSMTQGLVLALPPQSST